MLCVLVWALHASDPILNRGATLQNVMRVAGSMIRERSIQLDLLCTLYITSKGFATGLIGALCVGAILAVVPRISNWLTSALNGIRAVPLTLLVPFLGMLPVILVLPPGVDRHSPHADPAVLIAVGVALYIVVGIAEGISHRSRERERIYVCLHRWGRARYIWHVLVPEILPTAMPAARLALLLSLVLAVVLEPLLLYPGIGATMFERVAQFNDKTTEPEAQAIVIFVIVAAFGFLLDGVYWGMRHWLLSWRNTDA